MAITTLDGAIAGMQAPQWFSKAVTGTMVAGRMHSVFFQAGIPGAAAVPSPGLSGASLTTYAGQIPFSNPVSGNSYLAKFSGSATIAGRLMICDRLWHNSGLVISTTTAQTINSVAWPARDINGTINGEDVYIGVEFSTAGTAGTPTPTMVYVNSGGTPTKTGTSTVAWTAATEIGGFYQMGLAAGDTGVKSITSFTLGSSLTSAVIHLVAYRVLATIDLTQPLVSNSVDALTSGFPRLFDNTVPFVIFVPSTTTTSNINGEFIYTQG